MRKFSLDALAREQLKLAASGSTGRSATTVYGGHEHVLRQTMVALCAGSSLTEHESPGEATLIVLRGRVRLHSGDDTWEGRTGDMLLIPPARHSLDAVEDSAVVLTVAKKS
ncbi:cupin domain-containing protein [Amycolatopsis taiwanensis]|uniref:LuxR family transcriptional regulator n=1 Tax=Amycolatopsis taiwanensis TaxID=342230 RepID=A0A9W6VE70_9PSEU|nr:cupin domain-containing protein [Amycolatopsis taiwanensis]GLY68138.1 LuxR family transcriptional regulator [Amycolatopsis taiwanensis]